MTDRPLERLAVVGAGNMGSGIAQKMATEGFSVILVDLDDEKVARGMSIIERTLKDGVERRIFTAAQAAAILGNGSPAPRAFEDLAAVDFVVEAVFEDLAIKKSVFRRLDECLPSRCDSRHQHVFLRGDRARGRDDDGPQRVIGLHYFYHPAKNRLVEVVVGPGHRSGHASARLAPSGGSRQDSHRLERFVRLHRQSVLPALADRGGANARRRRREPGHDRRGGEEDVRDRHGTVRADERHRRANRFSRRDDARRARSVRCTSRRRSFARRWSPAQPWPIDRARRTPGGSWRSPIDWRRRRATSPRRSSTSVSARLKTPTSARAWACAGGAARSS